MLPKAVVIMEADPGGHRLVYVRELANYCIAQGWDVTLLTTTLVPGSVQFAKHLEGAVLGGMRVVSAPGRLSLADGAAFARQLLADLLVVPDGDRYMKESLSRLVLPCETRLLVMRDPLWDLISGRLAAARSFPKLLVPALARRRNPSIRFVWLREPGHGGSPFRLTANDPVVVPGPESDGADQREQWRQDHNMAPSRYWFGVVGTLERRKNVDLVAECVTDVGGRTSRLLGLALFGAVPSDVEWTLEGLRQAVGDHVELVAHTELLTNEEMNTALYSLDCVVLAYSTTAPNSTLGKAAAMGVPIVAAGSRSFRRFARSVSGRAGVRLRRKDLAQEMQRVMDSEPSPARVDLNSRHFCVALLELDSE